MAITRPDRYLITGVAGFIGSHLAERLMADGAHVVGIDNFDPFYPRQVKERNLRSVLQAGSVDFHELDVRDTRRVAALLDSDTVIVHLAAKAGVRPSTLAPMAYFDVNVGGTASMIEAASMASCTRMVFASSSSVYGDDTRTPFREDAVAIHPVSPYAASKRSAELLLFAAAPLFGLRVAALRFFTVYGPRQRPDLAIHSFVRKMIAGIPLTLYGDGSQGRDYTYCDDIVGGIVSAIAWTSSAPVGVGCFNLGGSRVVTLSEMVTAISSVLGVTPVVEWAPLPPGDVQVTSADLGRSRRVLGYRPSTSFEDGIGRFVEWYLAESGVRADHMSPLETES